MYTSQICQICDPHPKYTPQIRGRTNIRIIKIHIYRGIDDLSLLAQRKKVNVIFYGWHQNYAIKQIKSIVLTNNSNNLKLTANE